MTTYRADIMLSKQRSCALKPTDRCRLNVGELSYMRERNRARLYNLVIEEFQYSGISQAVLAGRLGKAPEVISRLLGSPGNWTQDTISDLLYAISGAEPRYDVGYPHEETPQIYRAPWLNDNTTIGSLQQMFYITEPIRALTTYSLLPATPTLVTAG
jgi:hypothetical protein